MQRTPTSPQKLQWDDVRLFLSLCRARTVGEAAIALGVDASTVSRRLAAMEEELSTTLFDRGRGGIAPTESAEALMPVAEEIEQAMLRFASATDGLEREAAGLVRITCPPDVAEVVVVPLLGELLARHPALRIELEPGEAVLDLTRREADVALRTVRPTRGDLIVTRLATARWILVGSPKQARAVGTLRRWDDAPWVGWGERLSGIGPARWRAKHVEHEAVVRSDSFVVQLSAVAAGIGVALVPALTAEHYGLAPIKLSPKLRAASADWPVDELFLVTHRALRAVPRVRVVWDHLLAGAGDRATR